MEKVVQLKNRRITYKLVRKRGQINLRISINVEGRVLVSAPKLCPLFFVNQFVKKHFDWIVKHKDKRLLNPIQLKIKDDKKNYLMKKEEARKILTERVNVFTKEYGVNYRRIFIKNQRSRWGSCSQKNNLNFNYKVAFLTDKLRDYIVVHEVCHLIHMNHSKKFWDMVAKKYPDYKQLRKKLGNVSSY